ncbi:MAG: class I lanthipeptide [Dysgonomonas sp.]
MKKLKKLTLRKETIASLNEDAMGSIKGGASADCTFNSCVCGFTGGTYNGTYTGGNNGGGSPSNNCTRPPRCCNYGCCETLYC